MKGQNTIKHLGFISEFHYTTEQRKKDLILRKETCVDRLFLNKQHVVLDAGIALSYELAVF